jgi:hypothetical protein
MEWIFLLNYNPYPLFLTIFAGIRNLLSRWFFLLPWLEVLEDMFMHGECWFSMEEVLP